MINGMAPWRLVLVSVALSFVTAMLVGGCFYLHLRVQQGSARAFNVPAAERISLANQPRDFYLSLPLRKLVTDPIRPAFPNQLLPIFYSDVWGDYWCYFLVYGVDVRHDSFVPGSALQNHLLKDAPQLWLETNRYRINRYLGRVNVVSILPSVVFLAGIGVGLVALGRWHGSQRSDRRLAARALCGLVIAVSSVGYLWFLIMYHDPEGEGDTIKAAYMLHVFPLLAFNATDALLWLRTRARSVFIVLVWLLVLVALHNGPTFITRYIVLG